MNRPKKHKVKNPTLPDDQQVDERNLIEAEESEEISFEDRIHMYWMENKGFISGCIALIALAIIGFNGMRIYVNYAEEKVQTAYAEAFANNALKEFALDYSGKPLAGLAAMDVADAAYAADDFETAIQFYDIAVKSSESDILIGRAKLGLAFSAYHSGNKDAGLAQLSEIASDSAQPEAIRAEAAYHLAIDADVSGDEDAFEQYASQVAGSSLAGQWQQRMQMYKQQR